MLSKSEVLVFWVQICPFLHDLVILYARWIRKFSDSTSYELNKLLENTQYYESAMRTSSMSSGVALLADRNFQSFCRTAAISTNETIINESDFPSLGVRSSPSFTPSLPTTSYGNLSPIPTHQIGIFSKDAINSLQRTPYGISFFRKMSRVFTSIDRKTYRCLWI